MKHLPLPLLGIISLILLSCASEKKPKDQLVLSDIHEKHVMLDSTVTDPLETKVIRLLITNHLSSYYLNKGQERGLEYELIRLYAKDRGMRIELEKIGSLCGLNDSIITKKMHLAASSLLIPEDSTDKFFMTDYLYRTNEVLVKRQGSPSYVGDHAPINLHVIFDGCVGQTYQKHQEDKPGIELIEAEKHDSRQHLIEDVANGIIDYTLADEMEARLMKVFYPNLEIDQVLLENMEVGFAVHPKLKAFHEDFNAWLHENRPKSDFQWTVHKYRKMHKYVETSMATILPERGIKGNISIYDPLVKKHAEEIDWDWKLVSALIYQESKFNKDCKSFVGARGLMQLMPRTGKAQGVHSASHLYIPQVNVQAGTKFLKWIEHHFFNEDEIPLLERQKFILASYNAGPGHIQDARKLAKKYGLDPNKWDDNVEKMVLAKSSAKYFNDPVCKHGYCRGKETVGYVRNILTYYDHYKTYGET